IQLLYFFFQAEDGIRDFHVTGVQTCALPISGSRGVDMSRRWSIDFETYSAVDLRVSGAFRYAEDPSTEALILAFSDGSFDPVAVDLTRPDAFEKLAPLFDAVERGETISAHNVQFERLIWTKVCKFPVTPRPHQWDCTAARARMIALPGSLEGAAGALGLEFRKDPRGLEL